MGWLPSLQFLFVSPGFQLLKNSKADGIKQTMNNAY
jgi:hypothetical protein